MTAALSTPQPQALSQQDPDWRAPQRTVAPLSKITLKIPATHRLVATGSDFYSITANVLITLEPPTQLVRGLTALPMQQKVI